MIAVCISQQNELIYKKSNKFFLQRKITLKIKIINYTC